MTCENIALYKIKEDIENFYPLLKNSIVQILQKQGAGGLGRVFGVIGLPTAEGLELINKSYNEKEKIINITLLIQLLIDGIRKNQKKEVYFKIVDSQNLGLNFLGIYSKNLVDFYSKNMFCYLSNLLKVAFVML
jgi:hypothetical protein